MSRYYANSISGFLDASVEEIVGSLTIAAQELGFHAQLSSQVRAWRIQLELLTSSLLPLRESHGGLGIVLEYPIPRRAKRIDAAIVSSSRILVLEFKVGSTEYSPTAISQVEDYCCELADFHRTSQDLQLVPILVSTRASESSVTDFTTSAPVLPVVLSSGIDLAAILGDALRDIPTMPIDPHAWAQGAYFPTPTIVESACHLYNGNDVAEIARSQAGSDNLKATTNTVLEIIAEARRDHRKVACFITGVPGAGKTLAGLNVVHNSRLHTGGDLGVFLSGNFPLVNVLQEALARDYSIRTGSHLKESRRKSSTFVQIVHKFIDYYEDRPDLLPDHVVVFDEAQRAWDAEHAYRKFRRPCSEPHMMLQLLDRNPDWAVLVALVGGGQEINTGEAGLREWGNVLQSTFSSWRVCVAPELLAGHHSTGGATLFEDSPRDIAVHLHSNLHLQVSLRSFRAERLSEWVSLVLANDPAAALLIAESDLKKFPLFLVRELDTARSWLRKVRKGLRQSGLIASSGGRRLRPFGIDVKSELNNAHWFLEPPIDVRSSSFLELCATEFSIQGLELDWTALCWDADLRRTSGDWNQFQFKGTRWSQVRDLKMKQFILNKYRVLLTRAREGMIVWVPKGSMIDSTRPPELYEPIAEYLLSCGMQEIGHL